MAAYTQLDDRSLRQHLRPFRLGDVLGCRPIHAGAMRLSYEVRTTRGRYILRILHNRSSTDARFEEALLLRLRERTLMVPQLLGAGRRGHVLSIAPRQQLCVFHALPGREIGVFEVGADHCRQVGAFLARLHGAARSLGRRRQNRFAPEHAGRLLERCGGGGVGRRGLPDLQELACELTAHDWRQALPRGIVHADLGVHSARFAGGTLCGVLDFDHAANGPYVYDVAVALGAWAFLHDRFMPAHAAALLSGYEAERRLGEAERGALYGMSCYVAARQAIACYYDFELGRRPQVRCTYADYGHPLRRLRALRALGEVQFWQGAMDGRTRVQI